MARRRRFIPIAAVSLFGGLVLGYLALHEMQLNPFSERIIQDQKVNTKLEDTILKTIAAFANAFGGMLLIGVDDQGRILGLNADIQTFKKQTLDYLELHLRSLLSQVFGVTFLQTNTKVYFTELNKKNIAIIEVLAAESPVFIEMKDKHGNKTERFFIRLGNSSREISSLSELNKYLSKRF